ncbi:MAG: tetratricopeptide repeat protein [Nannocystaceae bacterium]|nr:tetratricopeptide repeat protein [Nannocystaceae bacterium]
MQGDDDAHPSCDSGMPTQGPAAAASERARSLEPGQTIGRYALQQRLGAGGMGFVHAAWDPELQRKVAIKLLHARDPARVSTAELRQRLLREAQTLARLDHPNVVGVHEVGVHGELVFIVMDFVEGQTLAQWVEARERSWLEIVDAYQQAARGLAAAHAAGVIHRDFKPDNAMIDRSGRVRVMDFGIARRSEAALVASSVQLGDDDMVTCTGDAVGTPAYMSPEQFLGQPTDPRADQFSLSVALWEALLGQPPFTGRSIAELAEAVVQGQLRDPPPRADLPPAVIAVLRRGLASDRSQRFADVRAWSAALAHASDVRNDPARGRRRRLAWVATTAAALVLAAAATTGVIVRQRAAVAACVARGHAIDGVWNDDARAALREGMLDSGSPIAAAAFERVTPWFDGYAQQWAAARQHSCDAARIGEIDATEAAARDACLDAGADAFAFTRAMVEHADETMIRVAVTAAAALPPVDRCLDPRGVARARRPEDPSLRRAADRLSTQIEGVYAAQMLGRHAAARARAEQVRAEAAALPWPPLEVEAEYAAAANQLRAGDVDGATAKLEDSFAAAYAHGLDGVAASIAAELAYALGVHGRKPDEAAPWLQRGRAALQRYGDDPVRLAALDNAEGTIHYVGGDYERAATMFERTIALREAIGGPEHPDLATVRSNLGVALTLLGQHERAQQEYRRAEAIAIAAFGPKHPEVASALANRGNLAHQLGDEDEALALHREALAIRIEIGAPTAVLASSWVNIGAIERARGHLDEAERALLRALGMLEQARGKDHPDVGVCLTNLGGVQFERGHLDDAARSWDRALAIGEATFGPDHARLAEPLHDRGAVLRAQGQREQALVRFERALEIRTATFGPDHPEVAHDLTAIAEVELELGQLEPAIAAIERAVEIRAATEDAPGFVAQTHLIAARVLAARAQPGDRDRAATLGARAVAGFARAGDRGRHADAAAWLAGWLTGGTTQADRDPPGPRPRSRRG